MKKLIFYNLFVMLLVALQTLPLIAQELVKIETKDGNEFVGTILSEDSEKMVLKTDIMGELTISKLVITRRTSIDSSKIVMGEVWDDNPQSTRYLWTPNGYGLEKGEAYYQNIWVLYNQVSVGVSKNFSLSAGMIPLFLFNAGFTPVWVVPKFSIPIAKDKVNIGAGVFAGAVLGEEGANFGIAFGTVTFGDRNKNLNVALGWGYAGGSWADKPLVNVSGMVRVTSKGYFLTENYFIPSDFNNLLILSVGYRYMAKKVGIDFGLYMPFSEEMDGLFAIPTIGVTIPVGK